MIKHLTEWHSIAEEGLPKQDGRYIVHSKYGGIHSQRYSVIANKDTTCENCSFDYWAEYPDFYALPSLEVCGNWKVEE